MWLKLRTYTGGTSPWIDRYVNLDRIVYIGTAQQISGGPHFLAFVISDVEPTITFSALSTASYATIEEANAAIEDLLGAANIHVI